MTTSFSEFHPFLEFSLVNNDDGMILLLEKNNLRLHTSGVKFMGKSFPYDYWWIMQGVVVVQY